MIISLTSEFIRQNLRENGLLILAGALVIWFGFPNDFFEFPPLAFLWPIALVYLGFHCSSLKDAFVLGWLSNFLGGCCALYWLCFPVHDVGDLPWPLAAICAMIIAACIAVQGGIFCAFSRYSRDINLFWLAPLLALFWYILEYGLAVVLGFPWLALCGAIAPWPILLQFSDVVGGYLCCALWICAFLWLFFAFRQHGAISKAFKFFCFTSGMMLAIFLGAYGVNSLAKQDIGKEISALFVEGNIDQNQKWTPEFQRKSLDIYLDLTNKGIAAAREEDIMHPLVIWPETALPFFLARRPNLTTEIENYVRSIQCPLLFGAPGLEKAQDLPEGLVFNRAYLFNPQGELIGHYDKEHLVPFGEYLPSWLKFEFLQALLQGVGIYQQGTEIKPLLYETLALGMLICYEGIFPWLAQERVQEGANILVDISNDGWFRLSPAGRQHLYLTAVRSIEQNRWLLRATNTGISAVVDNHGQIVQKGPQFQAGWIVAKGHLLDKHTLFHRLGYFLPAGAIFLFCILLYLNKKREV